MIGIYKITNKNNNKCYISQSKDIEARWIKHLSVYRSSPEYTLYKAFKKYGIDNFNFEVLEECSAEELNQKEIYWIEYYNSFYDGYNMTKGGEAWNGTNDKAVYQYALNGTLIAEYSSAHEASRKLNISFTNICKVCRGERKTAGGFGWSYTKNIIDTPIKTIRFENNTVLQFTKEGKFLAEYPTAKEAERQTHIDDGTIGLACKGKAKTAGGFIWKYKNP